MDPNAALEGIRERVNALTADTDMGGVLTASEFIETALELAHLANSLDEWLSKGGFLPDEWRRNR